MGLRSKGIKSRCVALTDDLIKMAEYLRADARGEGIIPFLSPSQQTALLLIAVGVGVIFLEKFVRNYTAKCMAAEQVASQQAAQTQLAEGSDEEASAQS